MCSSLGEPFYSGVCGYRAQHYFGMKLVPTEVGTRRVERSEQSTFREAQYAGSRDDHVIE